MPSSKKPHYYDALLGPLGIEYTETSTKHDRTLDTFYWNILPNDEQ